MGINEYQKLAERTVNKEGRTLENAGLGLTGEAGEVADIIKKYLFHGHDLDTAELIKELGDVMWYVALACTVLEVPMEEVMKRNIDKLKRRYPEGFSSDLSINRTE